MDVVESGENVGLVVQQSEGVLVVGRGFAVAGATGPSVRLNNDVARAEVDHWLDAEAHTIAQGGACAASTVVGYLGTFVHVAADAVSAHFAHNGVAAFFAVGLHGIGDVAYAVAYFACFDAYI